MYVFSAGEVGALKEMDMDLLLEVDLVAISITDIVILIDHLWVVIHFMTVLLDLDVTE